jgi:subtilisin
VKIDSRNCLSFFKTCHWTHVSGIIAAEENDFGVIGVAPGASIYAVKVLDAGGFGAASLVIAGIDWAVANHMNIISMSLESYENNTAVLEVVNAAYDSGILLVAAGGNTDGG